MAMEPEKGMKTSLALVWAGCQICRPKSGKDLRAHKMMQLSSHLATKLRTSLQENLFHKQNLK
jgi:hypothetical protein